jgi:1-acyl-sn-glycerol-3-phosphate acyltransferase
MRSVKAFFTFLKGILHLLHGMWTITVHFPKANGEKQSELIAEWARGMLCLLNVTVRIQGQPVQKGPMLVVINHVSWLDILVMLAAQPVSFVSKSEVKRWPIIGWLATNVGTLYIERTNRRDALRVVHQIAQALQAGQLIAVFPEGTTSDGKQLLPFHANLLQAAVSAESPVQPVALRFLEADGTLSMSPVFIGEDTLFSSIWRMLNAAPVTAQLDFLSPIQSSGVPRRELAEQLERLIFSQLNV